MRCLVLLTIATACGRVGFDGLSNRGEPDAGTSPSVPADATASAAPPALITARTVQSPGSPITSDSPFEPGNTVIVTVTIQDTDRSVASVIDDVGDSFARVTAPQISDHYTCEMWSGRVNARGQTVTVTLTDDAPAISTFDVFAQVGAIDTVQAATGSGTASMTSPSVTTRRADELVMVVEAVDHGVVGHPVAPPFTDLDSGISATSAYSIAVDPGTYSATWPISVNTTACSIVTAFLPGT
jgi:hypothetical protein